MAAIYPVCVARGCRECVVSVLFHGVVRLTPCPAHRGMHTGRSRYLRHRFPPDIISHAVWLYHRYCLSFRDVEDLLAERGIIVSYETIRQWCGKFGPEYARRLKRRQGRLGDTS